MSSESGTFTIIAQPPKGRSTSQPSTENAHGNARHAGCHVCSLLPEPTPNSATGRSSSPAHNEDSTLSLTERKTHRTSWASSLRRRRVALPNIGLEASFVNVPHSSAGDGKIDSIIHMALNSPYCETNENQGIKGNDDYSIDINENIRRTNLLLESTECILSGLGEENGEQRIFLCLSCIKRIENALDTAADCFVDECGVYDEAATLEEERVSSIRQVLSKVASMNPGISVVNPGLSDDNESAIHWALDSFQMELNELTNVCNEQEKELRLLQNLMQEQSDRSKLISAQEDTVFHELNALEINALNFSEESHFVSKGCATVMEEIQSMTDVKLTSIPFKVVAQSQSSGHYPTINNLRLAYRTNEKSGLTAEEINCAWAQVAQLVNSVCGLNNFNSPTIRLIPLSHPCAKLLTNTSGDQSVHNLGCDATPAPGCRSALPTSSLVSFVSLLSQLTSHIIFNGIVDQSTLPNPMSNHSINNIDVTKIVESDVARWSCVVFCIAENLRWLSKLPIDIHI
mmetsp:Transcript_16842/g.35364  ORF Transcript_16842/g.35364 Transcript_16842/m.35364 type:complete len:515 (+) Transcript_16842:43-1587(+)